MHYSSIFRLWAHTCLVGQTFATVTQHTLAYKVNNRHTRKRCEIYSESFYLWTYSTPFSSVSIADMEKVNVCWEGYYTRGFLYRPCLRVIFEKNFVKYNINRHESPLAVLFEIFGNIPMRKSPKSGNQSRFSNIWFRQFVLFKAEPEAFV